MINLHQFLCKWQACVSSELELFLFYGVGTWVFHLSCKHELYFTILNVDSVFLTFCFHQALMLAFILTIFYLFLQFAANLLIFLVFIKVLVVFLQSMIIRQQHLSEKCYHFEIQKSHNKMKVCAFFDTKLLAEANPLNKSCNVRLVSTIT